jgi:hypothetical protein
MGFGLEAAINCHLALVNCHSATVEYDMYHAEELHRSWDPGVGGFSPFLAGKTRIAYPVPRGELFKMYSEKWFQTCQNEFDILPLPSDYADADVFIQKFGQLFPEALDLSSLERLHVHLWDLMANFPYTSRVTKANHIPIAVRVGVWEA